MGLASYSGLFIGITLHLRAYVVQGSGWLQLFAGFRLRGGPRALKSRRLKA